MQSKLSSALSVLLLVGCSSKSSQERSVGGSAAGASGNSTTTAGGSQGNAQAGTSSSGGVSIGSTGGAAGEASGGGSAGKGSGSVFPPGPPGCGLDEAAFCETFDAPAGFTTRAGELDPVKWSAARMCNIGLPSIDDQAIGIGPANVPACRSGLPAQVFPSADALVCNGNDAIQSNHLLMLVAAQNYGQNSYRIRQPFDFAGRTGSIVFDAEGYNVGNQGWISLEITEYPTPAPSFTLAQNFENGAIPENAVELQFYQSCGTGGVGLRDVLEYVSFVQNPVLPQPSACVSAAQGKLNHFRVELSSTHVKVFASPASDDGVTFAEPTLLAEANIALPFERGYVHLTAHNHATLKYSDNTVDAWLARWDNVGFDGPAITSGWREYEALDSLDTTSSGKVSIGFRLADAASGPAQSIEISDVDVTGAVSAELAVGNWSRHEPGVDALPSDFALNYRVNGQAWHARTLTASELQMMNDLPNAGTRSLMLPLDIGELANGTNTFEFTTSNAATQYPPLIFNIDLILQTN